MSGQPRGDIAYITAAANSSNPSARVGGITVLHRCLWLAARGGATRAIVTFEGELPTVPGLVAERQLGAPIPAGAWIFSADEVAGIALHSAADHRRAEWQLLRSLPKTFQGPIDALVNHHVSLRITRLIANSPLTPNHVTVVALLVGFFAAGLLLATRSNPAAWLWPVAGLALFFQSVLDSCDGELARLRYQFSKLGQWLDNIADDLVDGSAMAALGVAAGGMWETLGLLAAGGRVFSQLALYAQVKQRGGDFYDFRWWFERSAATMDEVYDKASPLTHLRSLGRRDVYVFAWAVLVAVTPWWPIAIKLAAGYGVAISLGYVVLTVLHLALSRRAASSNG
ncbi:MAG: CDP-alcohol phosphatidyltransferase family protein [Myxococcales bacterium]|nr:CDP-alcohol phosphatidyltransferase family protein [Myxococcales bacterium]